MSISLECREAIIIKFGFPPKSFKADLSQSQMRLDEAPFKFGKRERIIIEVDQALMKALAAKQADQKLLQEKASMQPANKGCAPGEATKMKKETVKADGNCLFNCLTLALEGVVNKPDETRQMVVSIMLS